MLGGKSLYRARDCITVVLRQVTEHMHQLNLFSPVQFCLLKQTQPTLKIQNDILIDLDPGNGIILVLLKLLEALDTIGHKIQVSSLQTRFSIQGTALQWFQSDLVDCD